MIALIKWMHLCGPPCNLMFFGNYQRKFGLTLFINVQWCIRPIRLQHNQLTDQGLEATLKNHNKISATHQVDSGTLLDVKIQFHHLWSSDFHPGKH